MDPRFLAHNSHWLNPQAFERRDPQLAYLKTQKFRYRWPLVDKFPTEEPGIYTLAGGRQVGKTTLLKQWMDKLLRSGIEPKSIAYFTGELIDDSYTLIHLMQQQLDAMPTNKPKFLIIDEVTYIKDWDKGIKFAADAGMLRTTILIITGSDIAILNDARSRFPGRRGKATLVDFHLFSLSFGEFVALKEVIPSLNKKIDEKGFSLPEIRLLFELFREYLIHGGYLTALNDFAMEGKIREATLTTYSDWIRGDVLKRDKNERFLKEILGGIIKRYASQITWNTLSADLSIDHPKTIIDYISILESMDTLFIQPALIEDKLTGAPKKARKVSFTDPFIYHAIRYWLHPTINPYDNQILPIISNSAECSALVESCVINHYRRFYPTFYIKGEGEVDIAYVKGKKFFPVEIKWTSQISGGDLKQILKYPNGIVLTRQESMGTIAHLPTLPIPITLLDLEKGRG